MPRRPLTAGQITLGVIAFLSAMTILLEILFAMGGGPAAISQAAPVCFVLAVGFLSLISAVDRRPG